MMVIIKTINNNTLRWKKDGKNRKDLLKAIHYVILLLSSEDADKEKLN